MKQLFILHSITSRASFRARESAALLKPELLTLERRVANDIPRSRERGVHGLAGVSGSEAHLSLCEQSHEKSVGLNRLTHDLPICERLRGLIHEIETLLSAASSARR